MTREEIYDKILAWAAAGKLRQKCDVIRELTGYGDIWRMVNKDVFLTSIQSIVATDKAVRDEFEEMVSDYRVMDKARVTIKHEELSSMYLIDKAAKDGQLLRCDFFDSAAIYIE